MIIMSIVDRIRNVLKGDREFPEEDYVEVYGGLEPRPVNDYINRIMLFNKTIYEPDNRALRIALYLYRNSDVVGTIIRSIVRETIKNGLMIKPKYVMKCAKCGKEFDEKVDVCDNCGSKKFITPKYENYKKLQQWVDLVNTNRQSLMELLYDFDIDLNVFDNAYILFRKKYYYKYGKLVRTEPIELIRGSPFKMRLIINKDGRYAMDDNGKRLMFCPVHRNKVIQVSDEDYKAGRIKCPTCGREMFDAYYFADIDSERKIYYNQDEVFFAKKFAHGVGYGYPALMSVWQKAMILIKMDEYVLYSYSVRRPPAGLLIVRGNPSKVYKMWKRIEEERRKNPFSLIPFAIDNPNLMKSTKPAEYIDMSYKADDINFIEYRNELRRSIGAVFGVMPLFQADYSTGVGLANEGLQITVTNRVLDMEQEMINNGLLAWITKQLNIDDYVIQLVPHEEKDMKARIERELLRIQKAKGMKELGYKAIKIDTEDGIDFKFEVDEEAENEKENKSDNRQSVSNDGERFQGEPEHGRMSSGTVDRYQGQPNIVRRKRKDAADSEVGEK